MDAQQFQRALITVLVVGGLVAAVGTTALYFVFRTFGGKQAGSQKHFALIGGLLGFIFLCCFVLFVLSR